MNVLYYIYNSGSNNIPVDYNLYRKFWSLQDFFRRPAQCYEKFAWKTFSSVCYCFLFLCRLLMLYLPTMVA